MDGELLKIMDRSFKGDILYACVFPNVTIGGLMLSRETIPIEFIRPPNAELKYALLEIGVIAPHTSIEWRVKVDGINVTKEFKPIVTARGSDKVYAKFLYDITSILQTPEAMGKKRVNVTFKREGGNPIVIDQISILALYSSDEAYTTIKYFSGALTLEPGENKRLDIVFPPGDSIFRSALYIPSKRVQAIINISDKYIININNRQGIDEIIEELKSLDSTSYIEYIHREIGEPYTPKELKISNLLLYRVEYVKPELYIEEVNVPDTIERGGNVKIKIVNRGESKPDHQLLVVMSLGNVILSRRIDNLEPGEEREVDVKLDLPPGEYDIVFRIIWRKLSKTWFREFRKTITII